MIRNFIKKAFHLKKRFVPIVFCSGLMLFATSLSAQTPIAHYDLDGNALDQSGNGNHGVENGGLTYGTDRFGNLQGAVVLDGFDDNIAITYNNSLALGSQFSVSAWVQTTDAAGSIFSQHNGGTSGNFVFAMWPQFGSGQIFFGPSQSIFNADYSGPVVNDGEWHHLVGVYDLPNQSVHYYVDGLLSRSIASPEALTNTLVDFVIGDEGNGDFPYQGKIDDVRLYSTAISGADVTSLYEAIPSLVASYSFDGNANDNSGNNLDGIVSGAIPTRDRFGIPNSAYYFDGSANIIVSDDTAFDLNDFTFSVWVSADAVSTGFATVVGASNDDAWLGQNLGVWQTFGICPADNSPTVSLGWHHLVWVRSGTNSTVYLDNVAFESNINCGNSTLDVFDITIGNNSLGESFVGAIDDLKIYNRALSSSSVATIYQEEVARPFITTWETTSNGDTITIPTSSGEIYDYIVDWGDGNVESGFTGDAAHVYATAGIHTISITGIFPHIFFNNGDQGQKTERILSVEQWGSIQWESFLAAFRGCTNLEINASDAPNLENVTSLFGMFALTNFSADLNHWNLSSIAETAEMFIGSNFNGNISEWNVSNVTNMAFMFTSSPFNGNIGGWDVGSVNNMQSMFFQASSFNKNIGSWNVSNVTNMSTMFRGATSFNQPIGRWDVSNVTNMSSMFTLADSFNQPLNDWNVSAVTDIALMFAGSGFNQPINDWDVSNVVNMDGLFSGSPAFNQSLSDWDISSVTSFGNFFGNAGLSTANYDRTIIGWATLDAGETQIPTGVTFNAAGLTYCSSLDARNILTSSPFNWIIEGDSEDCPVDLVAYYPFNGNANDDSGYGLDGVPNEGATLATDRFGNSEQAYRLNGTDGQILNTNLTTVFDEISISTWFNYPAGGGNGTQQILDIEGLAGVALSNGEILGVLNIDNNFIAPNAGAVNPDEWYHFVMTYDRSSFKVYINGVLEENFDLGTSSITNPAAPYGLSFGRFTGNAENLYGGLVDDARVYSKALTEQEIATLYSENGYVNPRISLMAIYNSANGDNWADNTNWGTEAPLNDWFGLAVDEGNVTELLLLSNDLNGVIAPEVGDLVTLERLIFFNNANLGGTIPAEIGQLTNLNQLNISLCNMTGEIPAELGNLTNTSSISLSRNSLSGPVPESFTNLNATTSLFLYRNRLTSMPDLTGLPSLFRLDVYENFLSLEEVAKNASIADGGTYIFTPQFVDSEIILTPAEGEEITLTTSISNQGTSYQWYFNGAIIDGATSQDYTFTFNAALEGEYYVLMNNEALVPDLVIQRSPYIISDGVNVAPTSIAFSGEWVQEQADLDTFVGIFTTEDEDPGEVHTFSLVSGDGDSGNDQFIIDIGNELYTAGEILLSDTEYPIRVRVTDSGGNSLEEQFIVRINPIHPCQNALFTAPSGTITDGSGDFPYNNNYFCTYSITLAEGEQVRLKFTEFDTQDGFDGIFVYDGPDSNSPLLAVLTGTTLPDDIVSTSNTIFIEFTTSASNNAAGWSLDYSSLEELAYYKLDNGVTDFGENGFDGTFNGASGVFDRFGQSNSALSFDGVDDFARSGATLPSGAAFSVSAWVNWDGNTTNLTNIFSWWNDASVSKVYLGTAAGSSELRFGDDWGSTSVFLPSNEWVNLVATFDGATSRIYLNGVLAATRASSTMDIANGEFFIARQGTQDTEYFGGRIDDLKIYDLALPASFIASSYEQENTTLISAYTFDGDGNLTDGVSGFDLEDFTSDNFWVRDRVGLDLSAFNMAGFSPVESSGFANYDFGDEITVSAWIRPDVYLSNDVGIVSNVDENGNGFSLQLTGGDIDLISRPNERKLNAEIAGISFGYNLTETTILTNRWTHVAMTFTRGEGVSMFINGEFQTSYGFVLGTEDFPIPISTRNLVVGTDFDGTLDNLQIFSTALSNQKIFDLYNEDKWQFDVLSFRGPESGAAEDFGMDPDANVDFYYKVLDIQEAGTYQFRATEFNTADGNGVFEAFLGDDELDQIAEPGGALLNIASGLHGILFSTSDFGYFVEPITSITLIGSARTGDDSGWQSEDELVDLGNGIFQIKNIRLFDGEWKLRMNNAWETLNWGLSDSEGEFMINGPNIPVSAGVYTLTADLLTNKYYLIETSTEPVAALDFDGDLLDFSGFGNDGTSSSTRFVESRFGSGDDRAAISLNSSQVVDLGNDPSLQLSNGFSLNMWINPRNLNNAGGLFRSNSSFHQHLNDGFINFRYFQGGQEIFIDGIPVTAPVGEWTMFTWTYDGGEMRFYDDGLLVYTETVLGDLDISGDSYVIGLDYDGDIDDFLWIDGVLSNREIQYLYTDGLILDYTFDNNVIDQSGNGIDGILPNGGTYEPDRFDTDLSALRLDGASQYVFTENGGEALLTGNEVTFSGWFKLNEYRASSFVLNSPGVIALFDENGLPIFAPQGELASNILSATEAVPLQSWIHFVGTYDGSVARLYINSEEVASNIINDPLGLANFSTIFGGNGTNNFPGTIDDIRFFNYAVDDQDVQDLYHENNFDVTDVVQLFIDDLYEGVIDIENAEVLVTVPVGTDISSLTYARIGISRGASSPLVDDSSVLTASFENPVSFTVTGYDGSTRDWTIRVVEDKELVAYYNFNKTVLDQTGNGFDAEDLSGSETFPSYATDPAYPGAGDAYLFDGSHVLTLANTSNFNFGDEMTITTWIRPDNFDINVGEPEIVSNLADGSGFDFKLSSDNTNSKGLKAEVFQSTFITEGTIEPNQWYHVAFTYQRNGKLAVYLNGEQLGSKDVGDDPITPSIRNIVLGNGWRGLVDELKIFNRALSEDEVFEEFAADQGDLAPMVHSVQPSAAVPGSIIKIHGFNFNQPGILVRMGTLFIEPTIISNSQLEVVVPEIGFGPIAILVEGVAGQSDEIINFTVLRPFDNRNFALSGEIGVSTNIEFRRDVAAADIDNDGDMDLISAGEGAIIWNENDGQGNFGSDVYLASGFSEGEDIYSFTTGDFDNDGDIDIVFSDPFNARIYLLNNNGSDTNWPIDLIFSGSSFPYSFDVEAFDFDADGDLDIISANFGPQNIAFLRNDGSNSYTEIITFTTNLRPNFIEKGDIDGDGNLDIVYNAFDENTGASQIGWIGYSGDGSSLFSIIISEDLDFIEHVHLTDMDNNGTLDLLTGTSAGDGKILWYSNDGNGTFGSEQSVENAFSADRAIGADLDGDGDQDIVAGTFGSSNGQTLFWYENTGNQVFSSRNEIGFTRSGLAGLGTTDIDNDGDLDLFASGYFGADPIDGWVSVVKSVNAAAEILAFSFGLQGEVQTTFDAVNRFIEIEVPVGTDLRNLIATFVLSDGAVARADVGGLVLQESGVTANDFIRDLTYNIEAEDQNSNSNWTVSVNRADGLLANYEFSGSTEDLSGNGFDLTNVGATLANDRFGNANNAYDFNGNSSLMERLDTDLLGNEDQATLVFWINPRRLDNTFQEIVSFGRLRAYINENNRMNVQLFTNTTSGQFDAPVDQDLWQQFAMTYDGTNIRVYRNAVLTDEVVKSGLIDINDAASMFIGSNGLNSFYQGAFDDLSVYNYPLTQQEIQTLYNRDGWPFNETPVITAGQNFDLNENSINGTIVGTVIASDGDNDNLTFSIVSGNGINSGAFAIGISSGQLTVADQTQLDFEDETNRVYSLIVEVNDGTQSVQEIVTVTLLDVNEDVNQAPQILSEQAYSVNENAPNGEVLGTVIASDVDSPTITYSISNDNAAGAFAINENTGELSVANGAQLNFENITTYTLGISVSDGELTATADIQIDIIDVNEAPTGINLSSTSNSIDENAPIGTIIGELTTLGDPDNGDEFSYSLISDPSSSFEIVGDELRTFALFDVISDTDYTLTIRTTDANGLFFDQEFTITVNNIPEPTDPYVIDWFSSANLHQFFANENRLYAWELSFENGANSFFSELSDGGQRVNSSESFLFLDTFNPIGDAAYDQDGNAYLLAEFRGQLNIGGNVVNSQGGLDMLILKYNPAGELIAQKRFGGSNEEFPKWIHVTSDNKILMGFHYENDFNFDGVNLFINQGNFVIAELTSSLVVVNFAYTPFSLNAVETTDGKFLIGNSFDVISTREVNTTTLAIAQTYAAFDNNFGQTKIALDDLGNVFVMAQYNAAGNNQIFVGKQSLSTGEWLWNDIFGGIGSDADNFEIGVDVSGDVYIFTTFNSQITWGEDSYITIGAEDILLAKYGNNGDRLWSHQLGSSSSDFIHGMIVFGEDVYISGYFSGNNSTIAGQDFRSTESFYAVKMSPSKTPLPDVSAPVGAFAVNTGETSFFNEGFDDLIDDAFTVEMLIKPTSLPNTASDYRQLFRTDHYALQYYISPDDMAKRLEIFLNEADQDYYASARVDDFGGFNIDQWHHVAFSYDGTFASMYLDGQLMFQAFYKNWSRGTVASNLDVIGGVAASADEVRVWNRALNIVEIRANMQNEIDPLSTGLTGYWRMNTFTDLGSNQFSTPDETGRGNDLVYNTGGQILEANVAPTAINLTSSSILEGLDAGTIVGLLSTTDGNAGDTHTYSLVSGNGATNNSSFAINTVGGEAQLVTTEVFDFDVLSAYLIRIRTDDGNGGVFEQPFTITVQEFFSDNPTNVSLSRQLILENQPVGTEVGIFTTVDDDSDNHIYSLVAGNGDSDNTSFSISGNQLLSGEVFVFDDAVPANNSFSIRVRADDQQNGILEVEFTITIVEEGANSAPTAIAFIGDNSIPENESVGFALVLGTTDPDVGDSHTYQLVAGAGDTDNDKFEIFDAVGQFELRALQSFDFETTVSPLSVRIETEDALGLTLQAVLTIEITNINEATIFSDPLTPESYLAGSGTISLGATISDEDGVQSVEIFLRKIGETAFGTPRAMTGPDQNGAYTFEIVEADFNNIGIEYFFQVEDQFGTTLNGSGLDGAQQVIPYATYYEVAADAISITNKVSVGTEEANYRMLAFPFQSSRVSDVFKNLGTVDRSKWRLLSWRNSSSSYTDLGTTSNLAPGVGYWFLSSEAAEITTGGQSTALENGVFKINLGADWNQIGNPFRGTLNWAAVVQHNIDRSIVDANNVATSLSKWNGAWQSGQTSLQEFEGAFVDVVTAVSGFEIPASAVSNSGGREESMIIRKPIEVYIDENNWDFRMYFSTPSYSYNVGGIGMHPQAKDGVDYFDMKQLPNFSTYLDMMFEEGVIQSTKESATFKTWNFTIPNTLPEQYIDLTWDIPVSSGKTIILVDAASQQIYDLSKTRNIKLLNNPSATHQLYYGDKDEIYANLNLPFDALFSLYPNPVQDDFNLEIYSTDFKSVKVEIISIEGKVAYTEVTDLQQGLNQKPISLFGKSVAQGVYLIKVDSKIMTRFIKL